MLQVSHLHGLHSDHAITHRRLQRVHVLLGGLRPALGTAEHTFQDIEFHVHITLQCVEMNLELTLDLITRIALVTLFACWPHAAGNTVFAMFAIFAVLACWAMLAILTLRANLSDIARGTLGARLSTLTRCAALTGHADARITLDTARPSWTSCTGGTTFAACTLLAHFTSLTGLTRKTSLTNSTFRTRLTPLACDTCLPCLALSASKALGPFFTFRTFATRLSFSTLGGTSLGRTSQATSAVEATLTTVAIFAWLSAGSREAREPSVTLATTGTLQAHSSLVAACTTLALLALLSDETRGAAKATRALEALVAHSTFDTTCSRISFGTTTANTSNGATGSIGTTLARFANLASITTWAAEADITFGSLWAGVAWVAFGTLHALVASLST